MYTGQLFESELKRLPHMVMSWVTQIVNSFSRVVRSATLVENREGLHCVMFPLILGAQAVHIARPGAPGPCPQCCCSCGGCCLCIEADLTPRSLCRTSK